MTRAVARVILRLRAISALDSKPLNRIRVVTTSGGAPAVLANTAYPITQIAHDSAAIYWVEASSLWRYDKRRGLAQWRARAQDFTILRADGDHVIYRFGLAEHGIVAFDPGSGGTSIADAAEPFADASAVYFRRGDQLWRLPESGGDAEAVDAIPHGAKLLGVGANRVFTTSGATNICTRETAPLHATARIAVDSCGAYEVVDDALVDDALVVTALPSSPRIDASTPAAARPGDLLRLLGAGFDRLATVTVGGAEAAVVLTDDGELDILVPKVPAVGTTVLVRNRDSGCAATFLNVAQ